MTILITGGAGFIGTALAPLLLRRGSKVVVIDSLHPQVHGEHPTVPAILDGRVGFIEGDVADPSVWDAVLSACVPQTIVHLAAETGTGQSLREAHRHASVNVDGTAVMLDALVRAEKLPEAIVLTSSRAVYGEGRWRDSETGFSFYPLPRTKAQMEAHRWEPLAPSGTPGVVEPHNAHEVEPRPTNVYAATKLAQEHILGAWCAAFDVPLTVLRLQNVYGSGQAPRNPYTGVLTYFARQLVSGERLNIYEGGGIVRDFVHISDVARIVAEGIKRPPSTINNVLQVRRLDIGSGGGDTLLNYAKAMAALVPGGTLEITNDFRLGDVRAAFADNRPAREALGYEPQITFAEGAVELLQWVRAEVTNAKAV